MCYINAQGVINTRFRNRQGQQGASLSIPACLGNIFPYIVACCVPRRLCTSQVLQRQHRQHRPEIFSEAAGSTLQNNLSSNGPQPRRLYFSLSSRISTVFTIRCTSYTADDIFQIRKLVRTQCVFPIFSFFSSHHGRDIPNCIAFCGTFVPRNVFSGI